MKQWMIALAGVMLFAHAAYAMDLDAAKSQGLVGEKRDGYLGLVVSGNAEAGALVEGINAKRREEYNRIAAQNGQPLNVVEKLAASKAFEMTSKGHYLMDAGGNWVKK